jgi:hypothetical protein
MGAYTSPNQVWYPDLTDVDQPNVYLATMAQSIDTGIGVRLQQQEIAVGAKLSTPAVMTLTTTPTILAMGVNDAATGDFNNGMTVAGGVITVQTKGMYVVSGSLGVQPNGAIGTTRSAVNILKKNTSVVSYGEVPLSGSYSISSLCTTVVNCIPGDTISMYGSIGGGSASGIATNQVGYLTYLTVAMVQAVL